MPPSTKKYKVGQVGVCAKCKGDIDSVVAWMVRYGQYVCIICQKKKNRANRGYFRTDKYKKKYTYAFRKKNLDKYRKKNKHKISAREAVKEALKCGVIKKGSCRVCNLKKTEAHHSKGYEKKYYLAIVWLCHKHHMEAHYGK